MAVNLPRGVVETETSLVIIYIAYGAHNILEHNVLEHNVLESTACGLDVIRTEFAYKEH